MSPEHPAGVPAKMPFSVSFLDIKQQEIPGTPAGEPLFVLAGFQTIFLSSCAFVSLLSNVFEIARQICKFISIGISICTFQVLIPKIGGKNRGPEIDSQECVFPSFWRSSGELFAVKSYLDLSFCAREARIVQTFLDDSFLLEDFFGGELCIKNAHPSEREF